MHHSFYSIIITVIVIQTYSKALDLSYYKVNGQSVKPECAV